MRQFVRPDGKIVRIFPTREPNKFCVEIDERPFVEVLEESFPEPREQSGVAA